MGRLLLAAASAACFLFARASLSGDPCEQALPGIQICDIEVFRDSASLLQLYSSEADPRSSLSLHQSVIARAGVLGKWACKLRHAADTLKTPSGAWPPVVVALLVTLAPAMFIVSLLLAVMCCCGQRGGPPKNDATTGRQPFSADIDKVHHPPNMETTHLHPMAGAALIAAWNTTSTMINFPFIFGVLGTLGGIGFTLLIQGAACLVTLHMIDLTTHFNAGRRKEERVIDFPGLGKCLGGKVWGDVFAFIQMLNQLGFLPYAITLMVSSMQALFPHVAFLQCNINACVIVASFGFAIVQFSRDWKDAEGLSYLTLILLTVMAVVMICFAFANDRHYGGVTPLFVGTDYQLFADCIGACIPADKQYATLNIINAIGSILFSFAPCFIIVEMMSEMEQPETHAKAATMGAFAYSSVLYCVIGLVFSILWGNQIPAAVHSLLPKESWQSLFINLVILLAMVLDVFIGIIVVNRYIMARFRPDFDYEWTAQNSWDWARVTFAPATIMFVMTMFIPNLVSVIGFVDCFCVPWAQYIFPIMFTVLPALRTCLNQTKCANSIDSSDEPGTMDLPRITPGMKVIFIATCVFGICWSGLEFYKFVHGLADLDFGSDYLCNEVASLS